MKKIILWILMLIGMFILSDFLIAVGLNSAYKDIERRDNNSEIVVYQAEATYVNGRIRGIIKDTTNMNNKYLEVELYSKRDNLMGRRYIKIGNTDDSQPFEVLFRAKDVKYYNVNIVDAKKEGSEFEVLSEELTQPEILVATAIAFLIFWV